jgi:hypothetical protein
MLFLVSFFLLYASGVFRGAFMLLIKLLDYLSKKQYKDFCDSLS